jgi:hypothetical protein
VHLDEEGFGEGFEVGDFLVGLVGELVDGQEALVGVEGEVAGVVVGEVPGVDVAADDEELQEAQKRAGVAVAGVVLVFDDLLHGPAGVDAEGFQLDLDAGHPVDKDQDIVAMVAVIGVDAELVDDLEGVFAPVLDVDQGVVERRAVIAGETVDGAKGAGGGEDIRGDDLVEEALELAVGEVDAVEGLEFLAEVAFQGGPVVDVLPDGVFQILELPDKGPLNVHFLHGGGLGAGALTIGDGRVGHGAVGEVPENVGFLRDRAARVKGGWRFRGPEMLSKNRSGDRKTGWRHRVAEVGFGGLRRGKPRRCTAAASRRTPRGFLPAAANSVAGGLPPGAMF